MTAGTGYSPSESEINDRVTRLAARLALLDGRGEDPIHPAVAQQLGCAEVVAHAYSQLPQSAPGRALLQAHGVTSPDPEAEAKSLAPATEEPSGGRRSRKGDASE